MPILKFQCRSCGLSFSKRVATDVNSQSCTSCGKEAFSALQGTKSIGYNAIQVEEVKPQSTGVESLDTNFERVLMQDSIRKWEIAKMRYKDKVKLLEETKGNPLDIVVGYDNEYVMDKHYHETQRDIKNQVRKEIGCNFQQK
jgi:hypothetical protein